MHESFLFSTSLLTFVICCFSDDRHSNRCERMVLICISLIISASEHLFICLLVIYITSLEKYLLRPTAHFPIGLFVCYWVVWVLCIFCILTLYKIYCLQKSSHIQLVASYSFLYCAETSLMKPCLFFFFVFLAEEAYKKTTKTDVKEFTAYVFF